MTVRIDLVDVVTELTLTTSHREEYAVHRANSDGSLTLVEQGHVTVRPSLIAQLRVAMLHSAVSDVGGRPGFMSQPAARLDALDALLRMDQEAVGWLRKLTRRAVENKPMVQPRCARIVSFVPRLAEPLDAKRCPWSAVPGGRYCLQHGGHMVPRVTIDTPTEDLVRLLHATAGDNSEVERDIRAWWLHAQIVTGWETPPFRPNNTCPLCGKRGGLRVRVDRQANTLVTYGLCVECKTQWTGEDGSFERLAWHIRVENDDTADTRHTVGS